MAGDICISLQMTCGHTLLQEHDIILNRTIRVFAQESREGDNRDSIDQ